MITSLQLGGREIKNRKLPSGAMHYSAMIHNKETLFLKRLMPRLH